MGGWFVGARARGREWACVGGTAVHRRRVGSAPRQQTPMPIGYTERRPECSSRLYTQLPFNKRGSTPNETRNWAHSTAPRRKPHTSRVATPPASDSSMAPSSNSPKSSFGAAVLRTSARTYNLGRRKARRTRPTEDKNGTRWLMVTLSQKLRQHVRQG